MQEANLYFKRREEIDIDKWDQCIRLSSNGLIYAYSFYLDRMADNWDVLVWNDYEAVMPLPWRKKFGIHYLYQPAFTAQLGVFGNNITAHTIESFFSAIPSQFKLWEFSLNHGNVFYLEGYNLFDRVNYVLSLDQPYETLYRIFRENARRNIKKSVQYGCYIKTDIDIHEIINLARQQPNAALQKDLTKFTLLYTPLKERSAAKSYAVFSNKDELLASCVFTFSHNRAYYILVANHPNGRTLGASHALIDAFIKDHAGQNLLLDFEGSDIRNLAFFYSSFGAREEKYPAIRLNNLPWYIKWMKN